MRRESETPCDEQVVAAACGEVPGSAGDVPVASIVRPDILTCALDTPLKRAAQAMQAARCSSIVVLDDNGQAAGIWTERDALQVDFDDPSSFARPVSEVMSHPIYTLPAATPLREAAERMRRMGLRHFLVVNEDGAPWGVLSQSDVVVNQGIEHFLHLRAVSTVVREQTPLAATTPLVVAAEYMREQRIDAVLVAYADGEHGILTERDLVRLIADARGSAPLGELASRPLITIAHTESLYRARTLLMERGIRHVGVTDEQDKLLGLVSFAEILSGIELSYIRELQAALRERDAALHASRRSLLLAEKIIESSLEGVIITDPNAVIIRVNPAFTRLTGYEPHEVIGKTPAVLSSGRHPPEFYAALWQHLHEHGNWQGEIWNRRKNGEIFPEFISITAIHNEHGEITNYAALFNDISKLKESEEQIRHLAYYDPLTNLPNRRLLADRLQMAIAHAHRHGLKVGVLFVDLDRFKQVNDSLGHKAGDELLEQVAQRLTACVREDDTVARIAGDEFVIVLGDIADETEATLTANRISDALRRPVTVAGCEIVVTASIGISIYPLDGTTPDELLVRADTAMYNAKQSGRNRLSSYTADMSAAARERLTLESELRHGLVQGEFELHYQPLVDASGRPREAEALLRWQHPSRGLVAPSDFVPQAEEMELMEPIGEWVIQEAIRQLRAWDAAGAAVAGMAVNVSARQLRNPAFAGWVADTLANAAVEPGRLTLEVAETLLIEAGVTPADLTALREIGVRLALDNFGATYCALNYIKTLPVDRLKIGHALVRNMMDNPQNAILVRALIEFAHSLGQEVVAEGVESPEQLQLLRTYGCDLLQGFLFSRPISADALADWTRSALSPAGGLISSPEGIS